MEQIITKVQISSVEFTEKKFQFSEILQQFRQEVFRTVNRDAEPAVVRHRERGKLPARRRIQLLIDQKTPFLELSALAANGQYNNQFPSAGVITGIGLIHGKPAVIVANDATVKEIGRASCWGRVYI